MKSLDIKKIAWIVLFLAIALFSIFGVSKVMASPEFHASTIASLDNKKDTVLRLTAASTAVSVAMTMMPGDVATPVAEQLADLSAYFLLILSAIFLEKYLVTLTGYIAFNYLIPAACVLIILYVIFHKEEFPKLAAKLALFGIALCVVIPASVGVSDLIEHTYQASIEQTIAAAEETTEMIPEQPVEEGKEEGFFSGMFSKVKNGVANTVSGAVEKLESVLNRFIEALAVMIVTSCIIPVLILLLFVWLTNNILGLNIVLPKKLHKQIPSLPKNVNRTNNE